MKDCSHPNTALHVPSVNNGSDSAVAQSVSVWVSCQGLKETDCYMTWTKYVVFNILMNIDALPKLISVRYYLTSFDIFFCTSSLKHHAC